MSPTEPWHSTDLVVHEAECIVAIEQLAVNALAQLTTEQLRALIWTGLTDTGWSRLYAELASRGAEL